MDGGREGGMDGKEKERGGWMDRLMDGRIWRLMDEWMDGWIDQYGKMGGKIDR